jgi:hypothetical protein
MNDLIAILGLSLIVSFYLAFNGSFNLLGAGSSTNDPNAPEGAGSTNIPTSIQNNTFLIEHLTQHLQTFRKNYRNGPDKFTEFGYQVDGSINANGQDVDLSYTYPILSGKSVTFSVCLNPTEVSQVIDGYGGTEDGSILKGIEITTNSGQATAETNYPYVVDLSNQFTAKIAAHIVENLQQLGKDDYVSRVLAAKNFVQHLPYGIPKFEISPYQYIELALPYESFVLSYSDCDSKSVFMAAILKEMIDAENIILVSCQVSDPNIPGEMGGHMFIGVAGMPFRKSSTKEYNGKTYHFIETTTPHNPDGQAMNDISDLEFYPLAV